MSFLKNVVRAVSNPTLAWRYGAYLISLAMRGEAVRFVSDNLELAGFTGFSEYHTSVGAVSPREKTFLREYPFGEGEIIDVGANLGLVSLILAARYSDRYIHAFEPNPSTAQSLRANVDRNDLQNVMINQSAVGNKTNTVRFRGGDENRATARRASNSESSTLTVPCTTLDKYVAERRISEIALLKVDVEGYETDVLHGCHNLLLEKRIGVVYFEVCPELEQEAGFEAGEAAHTLERVGYRLYRLGAGGTLVEVKSDQVGAVDLDNWVALPT